MSTPQAICSQLLSDQDCMGDALLGCGVGASDVVQAFDHPATAGEITGAIVTAGGGDVAAASR